MIHYLTTLLWNPQQVEYVNNVDHFNCFIDGLKRLCLKWVKWEAQRCSEERAQTVRLQSGCKC